MAEGAGKKPPAFSPYADGGLPLDAAGNLTADAESGAVKIRLGHRRNNVRSSRR
jgi:hypothetical protein